MDKYDIKSITIKKINEKNKVSNKYFYRFYGSNVEEWMWIMFVIFKKLEIGNEDINFSKNVNDIDTKYLPIIDKFLENLELPNDKSKNYSFKYQYLDNETFLIKGNYNTASLKIHSGDILKVKTPSFKNLEPDSYQKFEKCLLEVSTYLPYIKEKDQNFINQLQENLEKHKHKFINIAKTVIEKEK